MYKSTTEIGRITQRVFNRFELLLQLMDDYESLNKTIMNTPACTMISNKNSFIDLLSVQSTLTNTNPTTNNTNPTNPATRTAPHTSETNLSRISMEIEPIDFSSIVPSINIHWESTLTDTIIPDRYRLQYYLFSSFFQEEKTCYRWWIK